MEQQKSETSSVRELKRTTLFPARQSESRLVGESRALREVHTLIDRVAPTDASVLVIGESGTGKELVARAIHEKSPRAARPFIAINCGAIAPSLVEAELFGHEKGSFTGAQKTHTGVFERAEGGTVLLDEVTEMPLELQTRLLRVLESGRFFRVGGQAEIVADFRVIAATNQCPFAAAKAGRLREDVLYRLAVFPITLPPLRERGDDVFLLAEHFLAELNANAGTSRRFSPGAIVTLREHGWPGNVRELRNAIERAFILGENPVEITPLLHMRDGVVAFDAAATSTVQVPIGSRLDLVERFLVQATLEHFSGDKKRTAAALGCSLKTLYNKLHTYTREPPGGPGLAV